MARLRASQGLGKSPKGERAWMPAPERQYRDRTVARRRPKPEKRKQAVCAIRGVFSLGTFSCTSKRKYPDRGSGTASKDLLELDEIAPIGAITFLTVSPHSKAFP